MLFFIYFLLFLFEIIYFIPEFCFLFIQFNKMSFIDEQYYSARQDQEEHNNNDSYEGDTHYLYRKLLLTHAFSYLNYIKKQIDISAKTSITIINLRQIRKQDTSQELGNYFGSNFIKIITSRILDQKWTKADIFYLILNSFKGELVLCVICYTLAIIVQFCQLLIMFSIFKSVSNYEIRSGFIYIAIYITIIYLFHCIWQNVNMNVSMIFSKIKSSLIRIQYAKLSKMTSYSINLMDKGMLINLIANPMGSCQQNIPLLLYSLIFPINIIGYTVILVNLIGWPGLVGLVLSFIFAPFLNKLSQINSELFQDISKEKDKRINVTTQTIQGLKYIKLQCWENAFQKRIQQHREIEVSLLRKLALSLSIQRGIGNSIGILISLVIYILSYKYNTGLSLPKIFSTFQAVTTLNYAFVALSSSFSIWSEISVVFQRTALLFNQKNVQMINIDRINEPSEQQEGKSNAHNLRQVESGQIIFENFNGYWSQDFSIATLKNINLNFEKGNFYGIIGRVGSGKSTILAAILSQIPYYSGKLQIKGSIAYVQQQPTIFSDTVKNNIIFGKKFQKIKYQKALKLSCLFNDISVLENGDQTIIGEKGTTISGGQKVRMSIARALYSEAQIFLLDDPFSALDSRVAKVIYQNLVNHLEKQKTVILVTHQTNYLQNCDKVFVLNKGTIVAEGKPSYIINLFNQPKYNDQKVINISKKIQSRTQVTTQSKKDIESVEYLQKINKKYSGDVDLDKIFGQKEVPTNFGTYIEFFSVNKWNRLFLPLTILLFIFSQVVLAYYYRILSQYQSVRQGTSLSFGNNFTSFWTLSSLLVITYLLVLILKYFCLNMCLLNSSKNIHQMMVKSVIRSPIKFLDITPSGTLINKFTNDLGVIDNSLIYSIIYFFQGPISVMAAIINICQLDFNLVVFMVPLSIVLVCFYQYSCPVLLLCKQLYLQNKNVLVHFFKQNISGMLQIRILGERKNKIKELSTVLNKELKVAFAYQITSRAFTFYISIATIIFAGITLVYLMYVLTPEKVANFSLCVVYLTAISQNTQFYLSKMVLTDGLMVSSQRLLNFSQLQAQMDLQTDLSILTPEDKQQQANNSDFRSVDIEFKNYSARYRQSLPIVLDSIFISIKKGQRLGLVGRTGAGKSSILKALFRILQPEIGSIYEIGGENALKMGLHSLRKQFSIIPQTPFIFKESIRFNIDPLGYLSDDKIWEVLKKVHLSQCIKNLPNQLQTQISNSSQIFSMGQKQLLSLSRVLINKKNFLVMDEATSNIDINTDELMQKVIREEFKNNTIITIAHRLNTLADYDTIIVMEQSKIIEKGSYKELLSRKGVFYEMVENYRKSSQSTK